MDQGDLLRLLVHVIGRVAVPADEVRLVVGAGKNRIQAFNLCDGNHTLEDIRRETKIDSGNLSRAATSWLENGIAFWMGQGKDARLLHIYPIPERERTRGRKAEKK